uniref:Uncharacterized protein n=1 Tax=Oncorhynchus kisutch TaxID=8019 RepID=A0A8C7FN15_ONCKI
MGLLHTSGERRYYWDAPRVTEVLCVQFVVERRLSTLAPWAAHPDSTMLIVFQYMSTACLSIQRKCSLARSVYCHNNRRLDEDSCIFPPL